MNETVKETVMDTVPTIRESEFQRTKRTGLCVFVKRLKYIRHIKSYGMIHYVSKKNQYALIYVEKEKEDEIISALEQQHFVLKVEPSKKDEIRLDYSEEKKGK